MHIHIHTYIHTYIHTGKVIKQLPSLDLTTKDNVMRDSFKKTYKTFRLYCCFISYKQNDDITDINRIQEYEVNAGVTLDAAASGGRWGRVGYSGKRAFHFTYSFHSRVVTDEATIKAKRFICFFKRVSRYIVFCR